MADEDHPTESILYEPPIPRRIGPCVPLRSLGGGAFGTVYLAEMAEDRPYAEAGATVAVKLLRQEHLTEGSTLERFLREAELGRTIDHPCVVRTYETGALELPPVRHHFLVMEYVEGRTLRAMMDDLGIVPEALLRALAAQFAAALEAIHAHEAVHRDIKPTNILITPDHRVKLTDLGIARVLGDGTALTRTGHFVGTVAYAAPEQIRGEPVTRAADLYALGVVLYEAATGVQPFAGGGLQAVMHRHLHEQAGRAGKVNEQITPFLEEVIACLLEKQPPDRFGSAAELARVLGQGEASAWWTERERALRSARPDGQRRRIRVRRETPFVGREPELGRARELFAEAAAGRGRVLLIEGEAGAGKSRLLDELLASLERDGAGYRLLYGEEAPGVRAAQDALCRALVAELGEADVESHLAGLLAATPRLVPGFAAHLMGLPAPATAPAVPSDALPTLFAHVLRGLSRERPLIWALEDLHFAAPETVSLFLWLARISAELPVLLIATTRPELEGEQLVTLASLEHARRMRLGRLDEQDVLAMLADRIGSGPRARELSREIVRKSDGNPFFVAEMLRELKDQRRADASSLSESWVDRVAVPTAARDLLELRLREVEGEGRKLLDLLAVGGARCDPELVARVRGRNVLDVLERFAELERRHGLVRATGTGFEFEHHLMQELLYEATPPVLRRAYHVGLARAFERRERDIVGERAVFVAEHYLKGDDAAAASPHLLSALDHLAGRYGTAELLELARLALAALDESEHELRHEVRSRQADAFHLLGRREEELAAAEDASRLAAELRDPQRAAKASLIQGRALVDSGQEAFGILEQALAGARSAGDTRTEARIIGQLGHACVRGGKFDLAREHYESQLAVARASGDPEAEAEASYYLGEAYLGLRRFEEARGHLERSVEVFRGRGDSRGEARSSADLALARVFLCDLGRARADFERALACSREISFLEGEALTLSNFEALAALEGSLDEAERLLEAWGECNRVLSSPFLEAYWSLHRGDLKHAQGKRDEAADSYAEAAERFGKLEAHFGSAETAVARGRVDLDAGERERARLRFREAQRLVEKHSLMDPAPLPAAYLALLGEGGADRIVVPDTMQIGQRAEAHLVLHLAGAAGDHLVRCMEILRGISGHLEGAARERFWKNNRVAAAAREQAR